MSMARRITFLEFQHALRDEGYTPGEIRYLFGAVKEMDEESRGWVVDWIIHNVLPQDVVEGVTAEFLIEEGKYKPINAMIVLDWLKSDPAAAKYFVMLQPKDRPLGEEGVKQRLGDGVDISEDLKG